MWLYYFKRIYNLLMQYKCLATILKRSLVTCVVAWTKIICLCSGSVKKKVEKSRFANPRKSIRRVPCSLVVYQEAAGGGRYRKCGPEVMYDFNKVRGGRVGGGRRDVDHHDDACCTASCSKGRIDTAPRCHVGISFFFFDKATEKGIVCFKELV